MGRTEQQCVKRTNQRQDDKDKYYDVPICIWKLKVSFFPLLFFLRVFTYFVCTCVYVWVMAHVWRSGDNFMLSFLSIPKSQLSNSGRQAQWQVPLPSEPSHRSWGQKAGLGKWHPHTLHKQQVRKNRTGTARLRGRRSEAGQQVQVQREENSFQGP